MAPPTVSLRGMKSFLRPTVVVAGLVSAIHAVPRLNWRRLRMAARRGADGRDRPGHDGHGGREWSYAGGLLLAMALAACTREEAPAPVVAYGRPGAHAAAAPPPPPPRPVVATPRPAPPPRQVAAAPSRGLAPEDDPTQVLPHPDRILVIDGDTVFVLARRYGVAVRDIIDGNHLTPPYTVQPGMVLELPPSREHTVRPGETLYSVSRLHGVDTSSLARANHLAPPYEIHPGERLVLPAPFEPRQAPPPRPARTLAEAPPLPAAKPERDSVDAPPARHDETENRPRRKPAEAAPPDEEEETAALPEPPPRRAGKLFLWPVQGKIIGAYGPGPGGVQNDGINIAAPEGTPVLAADAGIVAYAGNELRGYGNLVLLKHADGFMTAYAHNSVVLVKRGDKVRRGEPIARIGSTGAVSEPQLHFEVRRGTRALDPTSYLPAARATAAG
jgi:murein DD-endopeptidase MepM/ murein hydrolase activator NlpD